MTTPTHREEVRIELGACQSRVQQLAQGKPSLVVNGDQLVTMAMGQVGLFQSKALKDLLSQLPNLVDLYQAPFDPSDSSSYKTGLFSHFEEQLSAELQRASAAAVVTMYEDTQTKLIGETLTMALAKTPVSYLTTFSKCSETFPMIFLANSTCV